MIHQDRDRLRLVLATESSLIGEGLSASMGAVPDITVVGRALGTAEMVRLVESVEPDALVVTVRTGVVGTMATLLAVRGLHARFGSMGIVIISDRADSFSLELLLDDDGARIAFLLDDEIPRFEMVLGALRTVCSGGSVLGASVLEALEQRRRDNTVDHLTGTEVDVLELVAQGLSNQAVADRIHLPVWSVDAMVASIFRKLGLIDQRFADRRTAAVLMYLRAQVNPAGPTLGGAVSAEVERQTRTLFEAAGMVHPPAGAEDDRGPVGSMAGWDAAEDPPVEVALVDADGVIVSVNDSWEAFCRDNGGDPARTGVGVSYLDVCLAAPGPEADAVGRALRHALEGELPAPMRVLIPCHSPEAERHFDVLISSRLDDEGRCLGATVTLSRAV